MKEKDQGFTLIELLVVMIIIGILAAVAIPVFLTQKKKANDSAVKSDLTNIAQQLETNYVDTQSYPSSGWTTTNAQLTTGSGTGTTAVKALIPDAKISSGDTILYKSQTGGFCLRGYNANGTANNTTAGSKFFIYDSLNGGLQPAAADSSGGC